MTLPSKEPWNVSLSFRERVGVRELNPVNSAPFAHFPVLGRPHGSATEIPFTDPNPRAKIFAKSRLWTIIMETETDWRFSEDSVSRNESPGLLRSVLSEPIYFLRYSVRVFGSSLRY